MNLIGQITRKAKRNPNRLNILTCPTHETFESAMANGMPHHTFYSLYHQSVKTWNNTFRKCPNNYILLKNSDIPLDVDIDVIISHNKFGQFQLLAPIAQQYRIPLISMEHTAAYPEWPKQQLECLKSLRGHINLFITNSSRRMWGWSENEADVLEHGIDTELFKPNPSVEREKYILSVCNQFSRPVRWQPCGFKVWEKVIQGLPWHHLGGDDPTFSKPAKNLEDLIEHYQHAQIFINTSLLSPIPMSLLEAASCGCAILTTATCEIPHIFTHGENCLMSNNVDELHKYAQELLNNQTLCLQLGNNARKLIQERFPIAKHIASWEKYFQKAISLI